MPRNVRHVEKTVNASQINKRSIVRDVLDNTFDDLAFLKTRDELCPRFSPCFFENSPARHNDVPACAIHFQNLERLEDANKGRDVPHRANIHLTTRQEGNGAVKVNCKAALHTPKDRSIDMLVLLMRNLKLLPGGFTTRLFMAQNRFSVLVFKTFEKNFNRIPDLNSGFIAGWSEFFERNTAL
jgi:hypothetical protein